MKKQFLNIKQILCMLMLSVALFSSCDKDDESKPNDETAIVTESAIPDAKFLEYLLKEALVEPTAPKNGIDQYKLTKKGQSISYLNVQSMRITDLTGIAMFTALDTLWCKNNRLMSLDVSKNTALTHLWCSENNLTNLNVSGCIALKDLWCSRNKLISLNVSECTALKELWCSDNKLTSLNVSGCTALKELECWYNQLPNLDVSKNTALTLLYCYDNKFANLDVSKNTALKEFRCHGNKLTRLDVSKNIALEVLMCSNNAIISLDVSKNKVLGDLNCDDNHLSSLDASKMALSYTSGSSTSNFNIYCGNQTTDGTTTQELTLSLRAEQKERWDNDLKRNSYNANVKDPVTIVP
ncbi:MAG: leucine-rich repeat domain-containing protein [Bacteroidales bacterium]